MIGTKGSALILMYHRVADVGSDPFSLCVTPKHFAEHIEVLHRFGRPQRLAKLTDDLQSGTVSDRSIIVTFDDGYADNLESARPLLERHDVPATVFVTTGNLDHQRGFWWDELGRVLLQPGTLPDTLRLSINGSGYRWDLGSASHYAEDDRQRCRDWRLGDKAPTKRHSLHCCLWRLFQALPESDRREVLDQVISWSGAGSGNRAAYRTLSSEELVSLARGGLVEIGAHTVSHPALPDLSRERQWQEVQGSKARLEEILGSAVTSFAPPYGAQSADTVAIVREAGFHRACSTVPGPVQPGADCFQLRRVQVDDWDGEEFGRRLTEWFGGSMDVPVKKSLHSLRALRPLVRDARSIILRVAETNIARLVYLADDPDGFRIAIEKDATGRPFDIQLNRPRLTVLANERYTIHFRARADQPRSIFLGFAQAHAPWSGLGLYKSIDLTAEWQDFQEEFLAAADDKDARIHFDLGGNPISVEFAAVRLSGLSDTSPAAPAPIGTVDGLEQYLNDYLQSEGLTFQEWMERFGSGTYQARNQVIVDFLAPDQPKNIFEFACAGGFLAKALLDGIPGIDRYTCSNYSQRAVAYSERQLVGYSNCNVKLVNADVVRSPDFENANLDEYDTIITTSFEHIEYDLELIRRLPPNSRFIFCVAGFDDPEHFRLFTSAAQIRERYSALLSISRIEPLGSSDRKYVCEARVRPEASASTVEMSVVVPCRKPGPPFASLLASLAKQTFDGPWEVIVVDNGLTAMERAFAESFALPLRLKIVDADEKANGAYARNVGVRAASGKILCFVDADDELEPGYLTAMAAALESHDFVTSRVDSLALNTSWVRGSQGAPWQETGVVVFFDFLPSAGCNIALRRYLFESLGGFREEFPGAQDVEFSWRAQLLRGAEIQFVPEAVYRYRFRNTLTGMYRQTRNWGFSNALLYSRFREYGMPGRSIRMAIGDWLSAGAQFLKARSKKDLALAVVELGYCVGRAKGSVYYRVAYL
jgi:peptidoglycan/xylan/chitin deacetylase (PgdA/CDA1 family)/glycosyltransferase involved in cell wall biosynthesis